MGERGRIGDPASVRSDHRRTVMVAVTQHFHDGIVRNHTNTHYKRRDPNFQCFPKRYGGQDTFCQSKKVKCKSGSQTHLQLGNLSREVWAHCKSMEGLPKAGQMLINM